MRYYLAAKLGPGIDDLDLNLNEFATRLNADIVGKLVNIASRCAGFITKNAAGLLADTLPQPAIYSEFAAAGESLAAAYESRDTASVVREIMALADRANQYIDQRKPWILAKSPEKSAEVQGICTLGLNMFRALMIYLQPILPDMATKSMRFFNETRWVWDTAAKPLLGARIAPYEVLATRLDPVAVAQLVERYAALGWPPHVLLNPSTDYGTTQDLANVAQTRAFPGYPPPHPGLIFPPHRCDVVRAR